MNFGEPFGGIVPGARGAVLAALLQTGTPLTGRRVHSLVAERHSLGSVQQALRDLEQLGLITTATIGRSGVHRINEENEAIAPLRTIASPLQMLTRVVREAAGDPQAVILFGSVARGEAQVDSDIDLVVIAPDDWDRRADLLEQVSTRLGNDCDVLHLTLAAFTRSPADREPIVDEILRDGIALIGEMPRRSRAASCPPRKPRATPAATSTRPRNTSHLPRTTSTLSARRRLPAMPSTPASAPRTPSSPR